MPGTRPDGDPTSRPNRDAGRDEPTRARPAPPTRWVRTACPACGVKLKVGAEQAGRVGRCPACGAATPVPPPR